MRLIPRSLLVCAGVLGPFWIPVGAQEPSPGVAKIASLQNQVETRPAPEETWSPSVLNQALRTRSREGGGVFDVTLRALKDKRRGPGWTRARKRRGPAGYG